jgi:hypothetical protein
MLRLSRHIAVPGSKVPLLFVTAVRYWRAANCSKTVLAGEVAEWLMAPVLKTGIPEMVSGVRIPPSPPIIKNPSKSDVFAVGLQNWLQF